MANDQREITLKLPKAEFWFLCMTRHLNVLYKCMKFHLTVFKLQSGHDFVTDRRKGKNNMSPDPSMGGDGQRKRRLGMVNKKITSGLKHV